MKRVELRLEATIDGLNENTAIALIDTYTSCIEAIQEQALIDGKLTCLKPLTTNLNYIDNQLNLSF